MVLTLEVFRDCSSKGGSLHQLDFVLSDSTLNPVLSDNWRHMQAVWSVLGFRMGFSAQ